MNTLAVPALPIMVVDDEEAILFSIDTLLRMAGFNNIITCNDSRDVMETLLHQSVEMMLLDLSMPHISGEELLSMITARFPDIPVVIITAATNESSALKCKEMGAIEYVIKPLDEIHLVAAINQAMSVRKLNYSNPSAMRKP